MLLVQYSKPVFHELVIPQDNFKGSYIHMFTPIVLIFLSAIIYLFLLDCQNADLTLIKQIAPFWHSMFIIMI